MKRCLFPLTISLAATVAQAAPSAEGLEFFEKKIRPVLVSECYECHNLKKDKGGLSVDSREGLLKGGDTGLAVVPGKPEESLLIASIKHTDADLKMPEKAPKLDDQVIADFEAWIKMGAPDPRDRPEPKPDAAGSWAATLATRKSWWSLQPVQAPALPPVSAANPIDRFIQARLDEAKLTPAERAEPRTLLRRITFALTGLPPTPEETKAFLADQSPEAYVRVIDRLLASPQFGERWGRHWMDLMRYAETHGSESDPTIIDAWRYRDYVIRAFNSDVPYDQLVREHIAGDLLPNPRINSAEGLNESCLGISQLRMVEHGFQPVDTLDDQVKAVDNQIEVLTKAFQGLTVSCARCHDHKFDAIGQRDFYALYGVLASSRPAQITVDTPERLNAHRDELAALKPKLKTALAEAWTAAAQNLEVALNRAPEDSDAVKKMANRVQTLERALAEAEWEAVRGKSAGPAPIAAWTFNHGPTDALGLLNGHLDGGAEIRDGRLVLDGQAAYLYTDQVQRPLEAKTIEAWVVPARLDQSGGGVMSVESTKGHGFDALVYAEKEPRRWVPGSDHFKRSKIVGGPDETAQPGELVHLVISYGADKSVAVYRNGQPYGSAYVAPELRSFESGNTRILLGLRHKGAGRGFFAGEIEEARLYDRALTAEEVKQSFAGGPIKNEPEKAASPGVLREELRAKIERARKDLAALRKAEETKKPSLSAWERALQAAKKETGSPLHAWAFLSRMKSKALADGFEILAQDWRFSFLANKKARQAYTPAWDLTGTDEAKWFRYGANLANVPRGEFAIEPEGDLVIGGLYPASILSHSLSTKHPGLLTSPRFKIETDHISVRAFGDEGAMVRLIVDNYPLGSNPIFPKATLENDKPGWINLDTAYRKGSWAYLEFGTRDDLTRPIAAGPKTKDKKPAAPTDGRSYYGVEQVVFHDSPTSPNDEGAALELLYSGEVPKSAEELAARYRTILIEAIAAWQQGSMTEPQREFLDYFVRQGLLPVTLSELPQVQALVAQYRQIEAKIPVARHAPGVIETAGMDAQLMERGEHTHLGEVVPRRYLEVFGSQPWQTPLSGRLELAKEMSSAQNPLTARVMVNRVWHWLFGRGLVATPDNFGRLGEPPSHPELLDYLATKFVEEGWSMKRLIRQVVTSEAYTRAASSTSEMQKADAENRLLAHFPIRRLEAEAIRDNLLAVSGQLDAKFFGPAERATTKTRRRSIYTAIIRNSPTAFLDVFDLPRPATTRGARDITNLPAQSLTMMNDPFVILLAQEWAKVLVESNREPAVLVDEMFERTFTRPPTAAERDRALAYLDSTATERGVTLKNHGVWADFAQALFCSKEFIYLR